MSSPITLILRTKKQPLFYITRDGFTLFGIGYAGEKAMRFKEAYIKQFNAMGKLLIGKMREREKGIAIRQALTKALQQSAKNERMPGQRPGRLWLGVRSDKGLYTEQ